MEWRITHEEELREVAQALLATCVAHKDRATVLALSGTLGAGKTSLVRALARELGIREHIKSPTFIIESRYDLKRGQGDSLTTWRQLVHIDAYRLESDTNVAPLRFAETFAQPHTLVCIEWPEQIPGALPVDARAVSIKITDEGRLITLV